MYGPEPWNVNVKVYVVQIVHRIMHHRNLIRLHHLGLFYFYFNQEMEIRVSELTSSQATKWEKHRQLLWWKKQ